MAPAPVKYLHHVVCSSRVVRRIGRNWVRLVRKVACTHSLCPRMLAGLGAGQYFYEYSGQVWSNSLGSNVAEAWPKPDDILRVRAKGLGAKSANIGQFGPGSTTFVPSSTDLGPKSLKRGPGAAKDWPKVDQDLPGLDQSWPEIGSTKFGPRLARARPKLA